MNNMFSSYLAPHLNMSTQPSPTRRQHSQQTNCSDNASVASFGTAGSRGSRCSSIGSSNNNTTSSKAKAQDYQVLLKELRRDQSQFQTARSQLASSLLRMGEYHARHGEYDEAMSALTDSLGENRSVVCDGSIWGSLPSLDISVVSGVGTGGGHHGGMGGDERSLISGMTSQWSGGHGGHNAGSGTQTPRSSGTLSPSSSTYLSTYVADHALNNGKGNSSSFSTSSAAASQQSATTTNITSQSDDPEGVAVRRKSLNDMISALGSLGKVNSLRGEDAAAVRYYDEKTKMQALRMNVEEQLSTGAAGCLGVGLVPSVSSGAAFFGEGHRSIMSEINEDVKALDELFRGISFRKPETSKEAKNKTAECDHEEEDARNDRCDAREGTAATYSADASVASTSTSSRKSRRSADTHRRRRMRVSVDTCETREGGSASISDGSSGNYPSSTSTTHASNPPLLRKTRPRSMADGGNALKEDNELADAIDAYRTVIDSHHSHCGGGQRATDKHEKKYAEFLRRYEALQGGDKSSGADRTATAPDSSNRSNSSSTSPSSRNKAARRKEWTLALDVYAAALAAREEAASRVPFPPGTPRKRTASDFNQDSHTSVASTLIAMGGLHYKLNDVQRELEKYEEALDVYRETLGRDHPHVAGTMKNIGMVLAEQGRLDEAMSKFREARRIYAALDDTRRDGVGPHASCDVASALSCMGNVQNRRGDLEDALRLYGEALAIYRSASERARKMGGRSRLALQEVASTLKIMGMVRTKRGELDGAMACFRDAVDILRQNFDEKGSGPAVTSILSRIGGIFSRMGRLDEAMTHYHEAYDLATRTFGTTDHPEVAQVLHYIGGIRQRQGDLEEAMRCYKNAAKIYQTTLGRNDPTAATTLVCIGSLHYMEKNLDGAMNYYKEALRLNRSAYGTRHPDVIPTMKSIALIQAKKENFDNAIEIFEEVLEIKRADVGHMHPEVASAHKRIGNVHYQRGDLANANGEYRKALSIYQHSFGQDHQTTKSASVMVEKVAKEMGQQQQQQQAATPAPAPQSSSSLSSTRRR